MSKASETTDAQTTTETGTDWAALWEEFGFDTVDGAGLDLISETQLHAALECTEQSGASRGDIQAALDSTVLVEKRTVGGNIRGYVYVGGER